MKHKRKNRLKIPLQKEASLSETSFSGFFFQSQMAKWGGCNGPPKISLYTHSSTFGI